MEIAFQFELVVEWIHLPASEADGSTPNDDNINGGKITE